MSEVIVVEAVSDKFANKFSNGSVLAGGKWLQVAKNVELSLFSKDSQIEVETKTNAKGYTSIVGVIEGRAGSVEQTIMPERPRLVKKAKETKTETLSTAKTTTINAYENDKNRRILVQGITQAAANSPSLAGLPYTNVKEAAANIRELALDLIEFVDEQTR